MKVLHIIPSVAPIRGGPSKAILEMVAALIDQGVDAEIATTNDNGPGLLDVELKTLTTYQGVPVRFFNRFSPPTSAIREFAYSNGFQRWLNKNIHLYDVIHIHAIFSFTSSYAMRLARLRGIPYAVRPIGQLERWSLSQSKTRKKLFLSLFEKQNLLQASMLHFTAESEKRQAIEALPALRDRDSSMVIPLGIKAAPIIDDSREQLISRYNLDHNKKILLYLSRLHPKKGLELLLDALAQLESNDWQLIVAGDGQADYIKTLKQKAEQLGLSESCNFIGFTSGDDKHLLLQGADLYTLTSHSENFGIAVLEALSAGTAVLVSKDVALSTAVAEHKVGFVCNLTQSSIKHTLESAFENTDSLNDPSSYVRAHYNWALIAKKLSDAYIKISA